VYDLFISHALRNHDEWDRFVDLLNDSSELEWRNFSLPWYDPAFDQRTPIGKKMILKSLKDQIIPSHCTFMLSGVFSSKGSHPWMEMEIKISQDHGKPIIAVPGVESGDILEPICEAATKIISWEANEAVAAIKELTKINWKRK
jgi:hypothetical protein|tara:strand:+ start:230 stop:661 length:432 start_codon:yes stop_codon:yes gene_type:complete